MLQLSNNNGAARIGLKLGGEKLYQAFRRFGFGQPTGIDIAGEVGRHGLGSGQPQRLG